MKKIIMAWKRAALFTAIQRFGMKPGVLGSPLLLLFCVGNR
jgi:hypothetical protein